jgi:short-subunit dehydrogenase
VITGASDGIGAELARQLAEQGAWLALGARRSHELDVVAQECIARGGRAVIQPCDVTDPAQCEQLIKHAIDSYGKIDVLVNNAGVGSRFRFSEAQDLTVFDHVMRVNYLGTVYCTHFALPHLIRSKGRLAAVTSMSAKTGVPTRSAYAASKFALHGFFDSVRIELHDTGVSVTLIVPGFVKTNLRGHALGPDGQPIRQEAQRGAMSVEECARISLEALARREREVVMRKNWKIAAILKVLAPAYVDDLARKAVE